MSVDMDLDELLVAVAAEMHTPGPWTHVLGGGLPRTVIEAWQQRWCALPADLVDVLTRINGIHLWADRETGRAHHGMAPLDEWDRASAKMWGPGTIEAPDLPGFIAISYDIDSTSYIAIEPSTSMYFLMDSCGADQSSPIGTCVRDLLAHVWNHRHRPATGA